jgi:hypothetical protein
MRATASEQLMVVTLHAPRARGFYEVWLLARDGVSMISLGELNADQTGTFIIPPGTAKSSCGSVSAAGGGPPLLVAVGCGGSSAWVVENER